MKFNIKNPLFILAAGLILLGASVVGGYTTAKETSSDSTQGLIQFETAEFRVDLLEEQDGEYVTVAGNNEEPGELKLTNPEFNNSELQMEHDYTERVKVRNNSSGDLPQYVRVVVEKRWLGENGETNQSADASKIQLKIKEGEGWQVLQLNEGESESSEQTVYYYPYPLHSGEEKDLIEAIRFAAGSITKDDVEVIGPTYDEDEDEYITITTYKDKTVEIKVRVDAVQARHAEDSILGAWGSYVEFDSAEPEKIIKIDNHDLVDVVNP